MQIIKMNRIPFQTIRQWMNNNLSSDWDIEIGDHTEKDGYYKFLFFLKEGIGMISVSIEDETDAIAFKLRWA